MELETDTVDCSYEPMDVDLSIKSEQNTDISVKDEVGGTTIKINKYHLKRNQNAERNFCLKLMYISFIALFISFISHHYIKSSCIDCFQNISAIEKQLRINLYGQDKAIKSIIKEMQVEAQNKIYIFYGGTGVGKTFSTSVIFNNTWNYWNIYHYTMPTFPQIFSVKHLFGLFACKTFVLIVDNLRSDIDISTQINEVIQESENLGHSSTVFLIYNCDIVSSNFVKNCDPLITKKLEQQFNKVNAYKVFVKFEPLTNEELRKCIENEILRNGISLENIDIYRIMRDFDVVSDGCKGIHGKINTMNIT